VIEGTEGPDVIVGTPEDDQIDSKGGNDRNFGDTFAGDGSGNYVINSGEGSDFNFGDTFAGEDGDTLGGEGSGNDVILSGGGDDINHGDTEEGVGSGDDIIVSGEDDDRNTGSGGRDIFVCGGGEEDTVTDYNAAEGDIATPDCENV
jgi:Ca2+-binding RTX toxin-like protein